MELKQPRTQRQRKRHLKSEFALFQTSLPLLHFIQFSNVGEFLWSRFLRTGLSSEKGREIHVVVMEQRKRNVQKSMMHVQSCCFSNLSRDFLLSPSPSSLLYKFPKILECPSEVHGRKQFFISQSQFSIRLTRTQRFW